MSWLEWALRALALYLKALALLGGLILTMPMLWFSMRLYPDSTLEFLARIEGAADALMDAAKKHQARKPGGSK